MFEHAAINDAMAARPPAKLDQTKLFPLPKARARHADFGQGPCGD
jgi:hypothetical protein